MPTDRTSSLFLRPLTTTRRPLFSPGSQHGRHRRCSTALSAMPTNCSPHRRWLVSGTAVDGPVAELRLEAFLPADEATPRRP
jgi:hypothetical protein